MFYVLRPELTHVLGMVIDLLWADQTLLRDWVVTKVGFGFVQSHAARHGRARWDLPLRSGEIYSGPLMLSDQEKHGHATRIMIIRIMVGITETRKKVGLAQG